MEKLSLQSKGFSYDPEFFYEAVVNSMDHYVYILDFATGLALISENMLRDFNLPDRMVRDLIPIWQTLLHKRDQIRFCQSIEEMMRGETDYHRLEYQICNRAGEYMWVFCRGQLLRDERGEPKTFAGVINNLSSTGKVDSVTGLMTQLECAGCVEEMLSDQENGVCLMLLGMDDFAKINHLKGHSFGDTVLRNFAQEIQRMLPEDYRLFRFDGDEVAVVVRGNAVEELRALYRRIQRYSSRHHSIDGVRYYCSTSAGIAKIDSTNETFSDLLKYAWSALETAKRDGRNRCTVFQAEFIHYKLRSLELVDRLQASVMDGMKHFELVYQPFVCASTIELSGAEALLRWSGMDGAMIPPDEFIPLLEAGSMMIMVGRWVLERAIRQSVSWLERCPSFVLNVNVSFLQMQDPSFVPVVKGILAETGFVPTNLVLELTESRFVTDRDLLERCFQELRAIGVRVAMDDFGTGYSSLGMLCQCPADIVKIDRAFIRQIDDADHHFNYEFIQAVIQLCHSVGLTVCVEGVETIGELNIVQTLGADSIQGYYVSPPIKAAAFETLFLGKI